MQIQPESAVIPSDQELVERARQGHRRSLEALAKRLACIPGMIRGRNRRLGTQFRPEDLEEIAQDTIMALWLKLHTFDGSRPLEAWAYGFAVNQHLKAAERRRYKRDTVEPREEDLYYEPEAITPDDEYLVLHESIAALQATQQIILKARHFEEQSFEKIAIDLGLPRNTVKTKYYRGLARLRTRLLPFWKQHNPDWSEAV